jgi:hypothetical protein
MRHLSSNQRSVPRNTWAMLMTVGNIAAPWRRTERLRWGASANEPDRSLPGEDLIPNPTWEYTHAVDINAPSDEVWPWILQIGQGRAGFYSFERLENLFGCKITNTDRISPELQHPQVGDEIHLHPTSPPLTIAAIQPGQSLVLLGDGAPVKSSASTQTIWAFHILPNGPDRCRLVERGATLLVDGSLADRIFFSTLIVEPVGFVMGREMLLGIKERAEMAHAT